LSVTIFENIEHGIFAMIGLSLAILLFRMFKAQGSFLGRIRIRTVHQGKNYGMEETDSDSRSYFLPLDRRDGSNPDIPIERPYPGIFIYRFTEGFNFPNANHHLDYMVSVITAETRPTTLTSFTKLGVSLQRVKSSTGHLLTVLRRTGPGTTPRPGGARKKRSTTARRSRPSSSTSPPSTTWT
jgi:MFS superfamily sulfate permease-like transporter